LAISQFFPQNMANLERKFQEKTFVWKIFEDRLGMRQGLQESMFPISLTHGYTQIGDKVRSTRVMVPKFSYSWLHLNWGWNRVYKSQDTQFLSVMAILKLGMKQGLQDSRYPISLSHGYSQIGDETGNTRVKVPSFSQSLPRSNWG
jgi:predicted nucleotide-binding protein (sugar kinase/HSP70/actin superfamily)